MIYLLRHGETVWNTLGRFQGQKDSPLTQRGILQVDQMAARLAQEIGGSGTSFDIDVSPLGRALETAARVTLAVPFTAREDVRLKEVTTGCWDGMTLYEIDVEYPGALEGSDAFDWYFRSPDGETFDSACARVERWLSGISTPVIAVSHGLTGRLIRGIYLGLSRREMLELPVPQDGFYRLVHGQVTLIE
ncbi:histidine phosphatase family protein [Pararhizobium sp. DWP1-1-3]|uniref:histidine phosphatase family protein n=1 Tax=Pararhizobium sp. DWP1-1-3 TaxID=2804652 RepID=UPI003CF00B32